MLSLLHHCCRRAVHLLPRCCLSQVPSSNISLTTSIWEGVLLPGTVSRASPVSSVFSKAIQTQLENTAKSDSSANGDQDREPILRLPYSMFSVTDQEGRPLFYRERLDDGRNPGRAILARDTWKYGGGRQILQEVRHRGHRLPGCRHRARPEASSLWQN